MLTIKQANLCQLSKEYGLAFNNWFDCDVVADAIDRLEAIDAETDKPADALDATEWLLTAVRYRAIKAPQFDQLAGMVAVFKETMALAV